MILARPAAIATHHVDLAESSIADALTTLHRVEADRYHPTRVYKVTLLGVGDEIEELVDWLDQPERKVRPDACIEALWDGQWQVSPSSSNSLPLPLPNSSSSPPRLPLRTFGLSFHRMNTKGYNAIARLVKRHGTLTTLDMVMGTGAVGVDFSLRCSAADVADRSHNVVSAAIAQPAPSCSGHLAICVTQSHSVFDSL